MKSKPQEEDMLPDQLNDELYRVLEHLQIRLNEIVQKSEDLLDISQQVSFQATLKRLNTAAKGDNYQKIPKTYFPPPSDQESFERKFKLLRRCGHILGDTMMKVRNSLCELHDATRKQKQDIVKLKKDEYGVKREIPKPIQPEIIQQPIQLDDDDDIQIIPKVEYAIEQTELLMTSIACDPIYHISCTCKLEEILEQKLPQELKLCIAIEALESYEQFYLHQVLIQEYKKNNIITQTKCQQCITYEQIYLNNFNFPVVYLNYQRTLRGEMIYFPLFSEISDLFNEQTLFLYGMYQFSKQLVGNDIQKVGNIKYLMNLLHTESLSGIVVNVFSPNLSKSQFLIDLITAMITLNGKQIVMGVNKLMFPECNRNPKIVLTRYTHKFNQQEKELLEQNINTRQDGGFRLNQFGSKLKRTVIIFSKEKIYIPDIGRNLKHWELPVDHIKQQCDAYHYGFLQFYIDHIVKCKIQDKLAKFFTVLITLLNQKSNNIKEFPQNLIQEFDFFVKNRNYQSYHCIKTLDKNNNEQFLQESLKPKKLICLSKDISRLLGIEED